MGKQQFITAMETFINTNKNNEGSNVKNLKIFGINDLLEIINFSISIAKSKIPSSFSIILISDIIETYDQFIVNQQMKILSVNIFDFINFII